MDMGFTGSKHVQASRKQSDSSQRPIGWRVSKNSGKMGMIDALSGHTDGLQAMANRMGETRNMSIKMIVTDLDGTLLREDKTVSKRSENALSRCRELGIKIVYATARSMSNKKLVPHELFDAQIINNGAIAYADGGILHNCLMKPETTRPLLIACDMRGLKTAAQSNGVHYSNFDVVKEWAQLRQFEITDFRSYDKETEKMYALVNTDDDVRIIENLLPTDLYMTVSRDGMAMIMHAGATKLSAVSTLAQYWRVAKSEIVAFGDDLNDMDLLSGVGIGVAMGNALDDVKAVAADTCDTNDNDGLAKWLEEQMGF